MDANVGATYSNITLKGASQEKAINFLREQGKSAFVSPELGPYVVVFEADFEAFSGLALEISRTLGCVAFAVAVNDDDYLHFELFEKGKRLDGYCSNPDLMHQDGLHSQTPSGGDARLLWKVFSAQQTVKKIQAILDKSEEEEDRYCLATSRHQDLVSALGIPPVTVSYGFDYLDNREMPNGLNSSDLVRVG